MPLTHNFTASPPNHPGFFSPQTSAVNFCEIDYAVTPYIAEFINSLTNLAYIYLSLTNLPLSSSVLNILSWPSTNISLFLVGITSFAFHTTLKHLSQISDELAMYAIVGSLIYQVYTYRLFASAFQKLLLGSALVLSAGVVGYINLASHSGANFDLHTGMFVVLLTLFWPRTLYLINRPSSSPLETKSNPKSNSQWSRFERDTHRRRIQTFRLAALSFLGGFAIWVCDGVFCHQLRAIRAKIGLPFAWLLEFHGVWHVLTAVGAGMFVRLVAELTNEHVFAPGGSVSKKVSGQGANGAVTEVKGTAKGMRKGLSE